MTILFCFEMEQTTYINTRGMCALYGSLSKYNMNGNYCVPNNHPLPPTTKKNKNKNKNKNETKTEKFIPQK